jgi:hypothetical protein
MAAEVTASVSAEPHRRTLARTTYLNGYGERDWDTSWCPRSPLRRLCNLSRARRLQMSRAIVHMSIW